MRQALRAVDPLRVQDGFRGLERAVTASMAEPRFYAALLSGFAGIALLLAAVGVFGSMSFRVARRLREMGIRMALGASSHQVVGMVVRQGLRVAMLGLLMGLASTLFLARFLSHFVFGITPRDPLTYFGVSALLLGVAVLACYLPARRAARIDPVRVLRNE
jgi:putative ABC transport system permease protein